MSHLVKDYMTTDINTSDEDVVVEQVAVIMAADEQSEGYVILLKKGKPVGIVTERDIVNQVVAKHRDPAKTKTSDIMSTPLITIDPDEDLLQASQVMQDKNVRKLAVVKDDIIYGVITVKDVALHCKGYVDQSIRDIIRWSTPLGI